MPGNDIQRALDVGSPHDGRMPCEEKAATNRVEDIQEVQPVVLRADCH